MLSFSQGIPRSESGTADIAIMAKRPGGDDTEGTNSSKRPSKTARLDHWLSSNTKTARSSAAGKPQTTIKPTAKRIPLSERCVEAGHAAQATKDSENSNKPTTALKTLTITEEHGDIFASPSNSVLIHACNCEGRWGAGIAFAFKKHYPKAYDLYHKHCEKHKHDQGGLRGTALLIPPVEDEGECRHYIGCLFTSFHVGFRKDSQKQMLQSTKLAMQDLLQKVRDAEDREDLGELRMCQINAGSFNVPWKKTVDVLETIEITEDMPQRITVVTR